MKSFSVLRTNVGLTTNIKVMVDSGYNLYLESIDSDPILSSDKYKKFAISSNTYYDEALPLFYTGIQQNISKSVSSSVNNQLSIDTAMIVKYDNDNDIMYTSFSHQFDDIYQMGCRNIIDNKNYSEEYECFAPLYIGPDGFPEYFIILRIDGPGLLDLNSLNFRNEIINNFKCISVIDLTKNTPVGQWIQTNFTENVNFPSTPFYMDFRNLEFSAWNGIDYEVGGYASCPFFLDTSLEYENTFYDFENLIYSGYKNNKVVFPNLINFSFLFNDTPATPNSIRSWSVNRYMGFYLDKMEPSINLNPYTLPDLHNDVVILGGNILSSPVSINNPFIDDWETISSPFIEINGSFYQVQQYTRTYQPEYQKVKLSTNTYSDEVIPLEQKFYKIISDIDLMGLTFSSINNNLITIGVTASGNLINFVNNNNPIIPDYDSADLWVIDINGQFHVIVKINNNFYIQSDYAFTMTSTQLKYWINSPDSNYLTTVDLTFDINSNASPFTIYKCNFSDVKDFDTSIVDTTYSKFEYELATQLTHTDETKMFAVNYSSTNNPQSYDDFIIGGQVVNIPASSEYIANGELFRVQGINGITNSNDLNTLWRKNPVRVKWGYQNSLSSNDYPYLLNNSFIGEDYNRTTNPFDPSPNRKERNLDYFYTVNSSTSSYTYHSLHIENSIGSSIDSSFKFELDKYLDTSFDYFSYFLGKKSTFNNGSYVYNTEKWSIFEVGDNIIPNTTLFRGLKFNLYDIDSIVSNSISIDNINVISQNTYQGYKFSILLSDNDYVVLPSNSDISSGYLTQSTNTLQWNIIDNWIHDQTYDMNQIVSYYDILYISLTQSTISDPNQNPSTSTSWSPYSSTYSIFWSPENDYSPNNFVYNSGEYYYYNPSNGTHSFWIPFQPYYYNDIVLFQNNIWISTTQSNTHQPGTSATWNLTPYWEKINTNISWVIVELWSSSNIYTTNSIQKSNTTTYTPGSPYVVYNNILYQLVSSSSSGDIPNISPAWERIYSIIPDSNYVYDENSIILLNNKYYQCLSNTNSSTLDNGICIYINNFFKNILVNIYIDDNTLPPNLLSNTDRDDLYNDIFSGITAVNFINAISDISNKYGFGNYLQYVIINEDGTLNTYNFNNISSLSCMITYQPPDQLYSRINSLNISSSTLNTNQIKPLMTLINGQITTLDQLNYYNGDNLATQINKNQSDPIIIPNYSGLQNNIYNTLYRHSGYYCPIFYKIQLFQSPGITSSEIGNFLFDTTLTDFGIMKERILSKVSDSNILKLSNSSNINSIYPMLDEFGYTFTDYFIFKSTWDYSYYIECSTPIQSTNITLSNNILSP